MMVIIKTGLPSHDKNMWGFSALVAKGPDMLLLRCCYENLSLAIIVMVVHCILHIN